MASLAGPCPGGLLDLPGESPDGAGAAACGAGDTSISDFAPGDWPPVAGRLATAWARLTDPHGFAARMQARHGPVFAVQGFGPRALMLVGSQANAALIAAGVLPEPVAAAPLDDAQRAALAHAIWAQVSTWPAGPLRLTGRITALLDAARAAVRGAGGDLVLPDGLTPGLAMLAWQLARNPDWQDTLRAEARSGASRNGASGKGASGNGKGADLADYAFCEALRLLPPGPARRLVLPVDLHLAGHRLAAGTPLLVNPAGVHHDVLLWRRPPVFDPMRFAPGRAGRRGVGAFLPLGAPEGPWLAPSRLVAQTFVRAVLERGDLSAQAGYAPAWKRAAVPIPRDGLKLMLQLARSRPDAQTSP